MFFFLGCQGCFHADIGVRGYIADEEEQLLRLENRFETREEAQSCFQALPLLAFAASELVTHQLVDCFSGEMVASEMRPCLPVNVFLVATCVPWT